MLRWLYNLIIGPAPRIEHSLTEADVRKIARDEAWLMSVRGIRPGPTRPRGPAPIPLADHGILDVCLKDSNGGNRNG